MGLFEKMMGHAREFSRTSDLSEADVKSAGRLSPREEELREELERRAADTSTPLRLELLFSGDVQGVGFRWTNQSLAQERHLTGWVRNLTDGTVRMEIQGSPRALVAHLERIHAYYARFGNRIWLENADELPAVPHDKGFDVRY